MPDDSHLIDDNNNNTSFRNHFSKKSKKTNRINDETFDDESQKDEDDYLELENDDNNVTMPTITNSPTATTINSTINSSSSSSSSSTTQTTTTTTGNNRRTNRMDENDICFLNHVNGRIFKSLERRGDSQFVIRELISSDQKTIIEDEMIITLPIALDRYPVQHLFPHVREVLARLNRVIGYSPHLVVFQTWKGNDESDIFIYDLRQRQPIARRLYRVFNARTYAAIISPDETLLLVTPDYDDSHSFAQASNVEATLIFSIESCNVIRATSARCDQRFAFDPRFAHNRLAEFDTVGGQIVDLRYIRPILQANHTLKTKVFRVQYTRDGSLICVVCTLPIFHRKKSRDFFIYILNSSTLLHMMQIIDFTAPANGAFIFSNTYTLLFSMYPSISIYSDTIALIRHINADPREREIVLYSLPLVATSTLKECCRRSILRYISPHFIPYLPLPASLVSFLLYKQFVDE
ncbi:hypothetical protein SNEBB_009012 [Seison nebaliae]|nr:hypothetical protein SNEBB_009012 [Seison nebaliae]